jgi:hypothetical protein
MIHDWLLPVEQRTFLDHTASHHRHREDQEPGTGQWFVGGQRFNNWLKSSGQLLWLYGDGNMLTLLLLVCSNNI